MQKAGKCFKKLGTTWNKNNVQSHDQRWSKLNSAIITNIGGHAHIDDKVLRRVHSVKTIEQLLKTNKILTKILLLGPVKPVK